MTVPKNPGHSGQNRPHPSSKQTSQTQHLRNSRRKAVALRYQPSIDRAPVVTAKGEGHLADRILQLAREHYIPVRQDRELVQVLALLNLDQEIPQEAYRAVAEILAFLYRLNRLASPSAASQ